jgi:hypothetical protein
MFLTRVLALLALAALSACATMEEQETTQGVSYGYEPIGRLTPVYHAPAGTSFRCVAAGGAVDMYEIPGNGHTRIQTTGSPLATLGNRRGDWLQVVARNGMIGWIYLPQETPFAQAYPPGSWCHVYQDADGRIVFRYHLLSWGSF